MACPVLHLTSCVLRRVLGTPAPRLAEHTVYVPPEKKKKKDHINQVYHFSHFRFSSSLVIFVACGVRYDMSV